MNLAHGKVKQIMFYAILLSVSKKFYFASDFIMILLTFYHYYYYYYFANIYHYVYMTKYGDP